MKKVILISSAGVLTFAAGYLTGRVVQKKEHQKKTTYAGDLQIVYTDGKPALYLALNVTPETLVDSADVILKVNKV